MTNVVFVREFLVGGWVVCKPNLVISDELIKITTPRRESILPLGIHIQASIDTLLRVGISILLQPLAGGMYQI